MLRGIWAGVWCVVCLPVGIWLALGLLERKPGEVPPDAPKRRRPLIIAIAPEPSTDWTRPGAYTKTQNEQA